MSPIAITIYLALFSLTSNVQADRLTDVCRGLNVFDFRPSCDKLDSGDLSGAPQCVCGTVARKNYQSLASRPVRQLYLVFRNSFNYNKLADPKDEQMARLLKASFYDKIRMLSQEAYADKKDLLVKILLDSFDGYDPLYWINGKVEDSSNSKEALEGACSKLARDLSPTLRVIEKASASDEPKMSFRNLISLDKYLRDFISMNNLCELLSSANFGRQ